MDQVAQLVVFLVPLILSLSVHEYAHAQSAWLLGDDTADRQGRRTLNPIPHIDPFGTLLFPIIMILGGTGFLFGWARPVPVSPVRLTRRFSMNTGMMIVAAAGPASNLVLAVLCTAALKLMLVLNLEVEQWILGAVVNTIILNLALCLFNMLPVYPLDGSRVLRGLLPRRATGWLDMMESNPMLVTVAFIAVIYFAGSILMWPMRFLFKLLMQIFALPIY